MYPIGKWAESFSLETGTVCTEETHVVCPAWTEGHCMLLPAA